MVMHRPEHGMPKSGKFGVYVRVSIDKQSVENQMHGIHTYLNGGDHEVKWFKEEGVSSTEDWDNREELQNCIDYCRKTGATFLIYSLSRLARYHWQALRFFSQEVEKGHIKMVVVDDPYMDEQSVHFRATFDEYQRKRISENTKRSLERIKHEIETKGEYVTKEGKTITKLGNNDSILDTSKKGNDAQKAKFKQRAEQVEDIIMHLRGRGMSYRQISEQLNSMGVPSPTKMRHPDLARRAPWHPPSVRNYIKKLEEN